MAKSKSAKRKRIAQSDAPHKLLKVSNTITPPPDTAPTADPRILQTLVSDEELETTIDTLNLLSKYPSTIKSKACKNLRVAVYDFRQACTTGVNTAADTNLTARITAALTDGKYTEARILLAEMRIREETPKLGALCRWVRDLDVISGLSMQVDGISHADVRTTKDKELLLVLDAVLRVTGPIDTQSEIPRDSFDPITLQEAWNIRDDRLSQEIYKSVLDRTIFRSPVSSIKDQFRAIETIPGHLRKPPNHHPAVLYSSIDDAVCLASSPPPTTLHKHPIVPNLSLIKNVLSPAECRSIIAAGEAVEFIPDAPIRSDGEEASILAHNFYWVADQAFCTKLWSRVSEHVPQQVGGKKVRGLNRRFRVYRYVPGAEYRCHIDGAWPPSGIDPVTDKYMYDYSPPSARQSSLFTFLFYLNDEFEAGETTFFLPSVREGVMAAYPVKPVMGGVVMFPHGETNGALLHEGTGVRKGAKYIIRTDVEYDVNSSAD